MDWRPADKVATGKLFKWQMKVIFVADQVPEERQYALILVAGGDKAYNYWDTLEDTVTDPKQVDQVWDAFEKINFILAFQRCLPSRLQTRPIGDNG